MPPRVLLLDPPTRLSRALEEALERAGLEVARPEDAAAASALLRRGGIDVALGERSLGGLELLREARGTEGGPPVILLDDYGTAEDAARALEDGAFEVLARPLPPDVVLRAVRRALEQRTLSDENRDLRSEVGDRSRLDGLESAEPRMRSVLATLAAVADSDATLLLSGESGVGKTRLARAVHRRSYRADGPFVEVNCGALPETLLESELFGHAKGAFTGAVRERIGKFEAADGGTLFLDEIATATPALQVKLLRVIEDKRFEPVGGEQPRTVDVRLIAATNRDLKAEVAAGRFREDLYYRIHVVAVEVPPLRERPADLPLLAARFLERFCERHRRGPRAFSRAGLDAILRSPWAGNVRELENAVERACLLAVGEAVEPEDLGLSSPPPAADVAPGAAWWALPLGPLKEALEIPERALLVRALRHHGGSRQDAARTLGINRTTLFNKMRKYGLLSFPAGAPGSASDEGSDEAAQRGRDVA